MREKKIFKPIKFFYAKRFDNLCALKKSLAKGFFIKSFNIKKKRLLLTVLPSNKKIY